jgi:hypothetical protein
MGRQVNFYMLPEDQLEFEAWLRAKGDVCFINQPLRTEEIEVIPTLIVPEMGKTWLGVYLAQRTDLENILVKYVASQNYWLIDDNQSPVVEFGRCYFDGSILGRGRLYFRTGFYSDEEQEKEKQFINWADKILKWIRTHYNRDPKTGYYIGPHAKKWILHKGGQLRPV